MSEGDEVASDTNSNTSPYNHSPVRSDDATDVMVKIEVNDHCEVVEHQTNIEIEAVKECPLRFPMVPIDAKEKSQHSPMISCTNSSTPGSLDRDDMGGGHSPGIPSALALTTMAAKAVSLHDDPPEHASQVVLVHCGQLQGHLHLDRFRCPGIHQCCVELQGHWISPKQMTVMAAKDKQKDWKGAIKLNGQPLRTLMERKELDFYRHDEFCSGRCVSKNNRLLANGEFSIGPNDCHFMTSSLEIPVSSSLDSKYGFPGEIVMPSNPYTQYLQSMHANHDFVKGFNNIKYETASPENVVADSTTSNSSAENSIPLHGNDTNSDQLPSTSAAATVPSSLPYTASDLIALYQTNAIAALTHQSQHNPLFSRAALAAAAISAANGAQHAASMSAATNSLFPCASMLPGLLKQHQSSMISTSDVTTSASPAKTSSSPFNMSNFSKTMASQSNNVNLFSLYGAAAADQSLISKNPVLFWSMANQLGMLNDLLDCVQNELRDVFNTGATGGYNNVNAFKLSKIVEMLGIQERVYSCVSSKRSVTKAQNDILNSEIKELKRRTSEQERIQQVFKRKSQLLDHLVSTNLVAGMSNQGAVSNHSSPTPAKQARHSVGGPMNFFGNLHKMNSSSPSCST